MREVALKPSVHVLVCTNVRPTTDPLGPGCAERGERLYDTFKDRVSQKNTHRSLWIARTRCLGVCPKHGATVIVHPNAVVLADVEPADVDSILSAAEERVARSTR